MVDMARSKTRSVLFLCTGNYYRSRFAEILFDSVAVKFGLPWRATSRALALERGVRNVGPMAKSAVQLLRTRGIVSPAFDRAPTQVLPADFESADLVIALKEAEHRPLLIERYPAWAERVEYWQVEDDDDALPLVERSVMELTARMLGGGGVGPSDTRVSNTPPAARAPTPVKRIAKVGRETKGRRGKGVTTVTGLTLDEPGLQELAARLKERCGTGGTVKDGRIEIQGDLRDRVAEELQRIGYTVKRVGG
jgi:predicted translation initiation factor SUI1